MFRASVGGHSARVTLVAPAGSSPAARTRTTTRRARATCAPCPWCRTGDVEFGWYPAALADVEASLGVTARLAAACRGSGDRPLLDRLAHAFARFRTRGTAVPAGEDGAGPAVVDVGAGFGGPAAWLARAHGLRTLGVEPSLPALAAARTLFPDLPVVRGEAGRLPLADGAHDGALMLGVVSLVDDVPQALAQARRVVRDGGLLALTDYVGLDAADRTAAREAAAAGRPLLPRGTKVRLLGDVLGGVRAAGWSVLESTVGPVAPDPQWAAVRRAVDQLVEAYVARTPHGTGAACPFALRAERRVRAQFGTAIASHRVTRLTLVARAV